MILTLRTLPRSDGTTSVILTRGESDPRDPEVVGRFPDSTEAVVWILAKVAQIKVKAGPAFRSVETRTRYDRGGKASGTVKFDLDLEPGTQVNW